MTDHVDNPFESPATLSICTGIGGLERGVERVTGPLRTIAYVEIEAFIIENLLAVMETGILAPAPVWANLKTFPWEQFRGKVGLLMGGYPCQPFSVAGKQKGKSDPRHLWPFIKSGIRATKPLGCFFENVGAHLNLGYEEVKRDLEEMGYVVKEGIYSAEEVGAPHIRERLFILAMLDNPSSYGFWKKYAVSAGKNGIDPSGEMANANGAERREGYPRGSGRIENDLFRIGPKSTNRPECPSKELGDSEGIGERKPPDQAVAITTIGETWQEPGKSGELADTVGRDGSGAGNEPKKAGRHEFADRCQELAITRSKGLEGFGPRGIGSGQEFPLSASGRSNGWPARPGQQQYEWEESRTIITQQAARLLGGYGKKHPESFPARQIEQVALDGFAGTIEPRLGCTIDGYNFREDLLRALGNGVVEQTAELAFKDLLRKHFA